MTFTKPKKVSRNLQGDITDIKVTTKRTPQKPIDNDWIKPYWLERDRVLYKTCDEETKLAILKRYGKE